MPKTRRPRNGVVHAMPPQEGSDQPRRLSGDHLYTWAQLVSAVNNALGQMQAYGREVGAHYDMQPDEIIDNAGYIIKNPQGPPPRIVPPRVEDPEG